MAFQKFSNTLPPVHGEPTFMIGKGGTFVISGSVWDAIGQPTLVELFYDPETKRVAMSPATDETADGTYKLRKTGNTFAASGAALCGYFGIDTDVSVRRPAIIENGMAVADLNDVGETIVSNRGRKKAEDGSADVPAEEAAVDAPPVTDSDSAKPVGRKR